MPNCSNCGRPVSAGQYFEIGDKILCMKCLHEDHNVNKKHMEKENPKQISCPSCGKIYDYYLRKCPQCHEWNPVYDYNTKEVFRNLFAGSLVLGVPVTIILSLGLLAVGLSIVIPFLLIIFFLQLTIGLYLETHMTGVAFSIARSIRDMFSKERKKGKQKN
jgi:hypothetical protein